MSDLPDFLLARIAEDERRARAAADRLPLIYDDAVLRDKGIGIAQAVFIAHWPPARVLAECGAKRRIVEDLRDELANQHDPEPTTLQLAERTLLALALPYADHEDYREEWRP